MRYFVDRENKKIVLDSEDFTQEDIERIIELYEHILKDEI